MPASAPAPTAIRHYWFGKAYRDMLATIGDAHKRNLDTAKDYWDKIRMADEGIQQWLCFIFFGIAGLSVLVFGTVVWIILIPIHATIVALIALCIMVCFVCVSFAERCYLLYKGWTTVCRHCGDRVQLPEYQCPGCRRWHPELRPSSYGILNHTCRCGKKLSCTFIGERHRLVARCPHTDCKREMDAAVETRSATTVIPILGPPASGKTGLMIAVMEVFQKRLGPRYMLRGSFTDRDSGLFFEDEKRHIEVTGSTRKTTDEKPPALDAFFESSDGQYRQQLYLFDAAGEIFRNSDKLAAHYQFKHISGGIIVIDPFSLSLLKEKYGERFAKHGLGVAFSEDDAIDSLERFLIGMERHFGLKHGKLISQPFAVIVTKTDLAKLHDELVPVVGSSPECASQHVRSKIQAWGGKALVNLLDNRFSKIRFFAAAPIQLKKRSDGKGYSGELIARGLEEALVWLLETANDPFVNRVR